MQHRRPIPDVEEDDPARPRVRGGVPERVPHVLVAELVAEQRERHQRDVELALDARRACIAFDQQRPRRPPPALSPVRARASPARGRCPRPRDRAAPARPRGHPFRSRCRARALAAGPGSSAASRSMSIALGAVVLVGIEGVVGRRVARSEDAGHASAVLDRVADRRLLLVGQGEAGRQVEAAPRQPLGHRVALARRTARARAMPAARASRGRTAACRRRARARRRAELDRVEWHVVARGRGRTSSSTLRAHGSSTCSCRPETPLSRRNVLGAERALALDDLRPCARSARRRARPGDSSGGS